MLHISTKTLDLTRVVIYSKVVTNKFKNMFIHTFSNNTKYKILFNHIITCNDYKTHPLLKSRTAKFNVHVFVSRYNNQLILKTTVCEGGLIIQTSLYHRNQESRVNALMLYQLCVFFVCKFSVFAYVCFRFMIIISYRSF